MIALGGRQCKYRRTKENGAFVFIHSGSELRKRTRTRMRWAITHQQVILYGKTKETKKMLLREQHVPTDRVSHWACSARRVVLFHTKRKRKQRLGPAKKKTEKQKASSVVAATEAAALELWFHRRSVSVAFEIRCRRLPVWPISQVPYEKPHEPRPLLIEQSRKRLLPNHSRFSLSLSLFLGRPFLFRSCQAKRPQRLLLVDGHWSTAAATDVYCDESFVYTRNVFPFSFVGRPASEEMAAEKRRRGCDWSPSSRAGRCQWIEDDSGILYSDYCIGKKERKKDWAPRKSSSSWARDAAGRDRLESDLVVGSREGRSFLPSSRGRAVLWLGRSKGREKKERNWSGHQEAASPSCSAGDQLLQTL